MSADENLERMKTLGEIVEENLFYDQVGFLRQIGVM